MLCAQVACHTPSLHDVWLPGTDWERRGGTCICYWKREGDTAQFPPSPPPLAPLSAQGWGRVVKVVGLTSTNYISLYLWIVTRREVVCCCVHVVIRVSDVVGVRWRGRVRVGRRAQAGGRRRSRVGRLTVPVRALPARTLCLLLLLLLLLLSLPARVTLGSFWPAGRPFRAAARPREVLLPHDMCHCYSSAAKARL